MTTVSDVTGRFRAAMYDTAVAVLTPLADAKYPMRVVNGHPGMNRPADLIKIGRAESTQDFATFTPNRTRELVMTVEVTATCVRPPNKANKDDSDTIARGYDLLNALEEHVRVTDTTLGGLVRWCFCTALSDEGETDDELVGSGRDVPVTAVFTARARITS